MSVRDASTALATALRALLWMVGIAIVGIASAMIVTMGESSASQAGRYYVAIGAIVVLGAVERQLARLVSQGRAGRGAGRGGERQAHLRRFLVLFAAGLFLLGLAHYQSAGASSGLAWLLVYGLALAATPFVVAFVLNRFVRQAFDRGIDLLFSAREDRPGRESRPRTFSFSFGTSPMPPEPGGSNTPPPLALAPDRAAQYREAWDRTRRHFEQDPAEAVRRAHRLLLEVCSATEHSGAFSRTGQFAAATPSGVGSVLGATVGRIHEARRAHVAIQAALVGKPAKPEDLARAMAEYERLLKELLGGS